MRRALLITAIVLGLGPVVGAGATVVGMIRTFDQVSAMGDKADPAILAKGIHDALIGVVIGLHAFMVSVGLFWVWCGQERVRARRKPVWIYLFVMSIITLFLGRGGLVLGVVVLVLLFLVDALRFWEWRARPPNGSTTAAPTEGGAGGDE